MTLAPLPVSASRPHALLYPAQAILDAHKSELSRLTLIELDREMARKLADRIDAQGFEYVGMVGDDASITQSIRFRRSIKVKTA